MCDQNPDVRHQRAQFLFHAENVGNARTDEKDLAVAEFFAVNGLFYHYLVKRHDKGSGRQTVNRRRSDNTQLLDPGQRHLQRARYRRGGQRQDMNIRLQCLELFLMRNAEMLFFVDNQQTEIAELNVFGQQRMGADDYFHGTVFQSLFGFGGLFGRNQAGKHSDPYRKTFHAFFEIVIMLTREQCGRHNQRHLSAGHCHGKSRAQSNLGLAEADVAANQPVHRRTLIQVF